MTPPPRVLGLVCATIGALACSGSPGRVGATDASHPSTTGTAGCTAAASCSGAAGATDVGAAGAAGLGGSAGAATEPTSPIDAAALDAALDANDAASEPALAACAGLFCEDFESGALDPAKWGVTAGVNHADVAAPTDVVQTAVVAHGKYAAHFHGRGDAMDDNAFISTRSLPAALATHNFGRAYVYLTPKPTSGHMAMVVAGTDVYASTPKLRDFEVANISDGWQIGYDSLGLTPSGEEVSYPPGQMPSGKWICLEWEFNDAPDAITLWLDGTELGTFDDQHVNYPSGHLPGTPIFDGKSSGLVGGFTTYGFGYYDWHPHADFDIYYDDLVLDVKRVGCTI